MFFVVVCFQYRLIVGQHRLAAYCPRERQKKSWNNKKDKEVSKENEQRKEITEQKSIGTDKGLQFSSLTER